MRGATTFCRLTRRRRCAARTNLFFARFLADLGIHSSGDLLRRAEEGLRFLPKLRQIAESIMHANPEITGIE
ncbi:hypothetical protein CM49_01336 [Paenibacillus sp. P1XP2]|nr:hypothetical protein CM49_01336 [Paenibacillus sp. P1XP2]